MPTSDAVRHHYIAQMLLGEFLDDSSSRERLWQLDKHTGHVVAQTTKAAASGQRLYRVEHADGYPSDHLEGFLAMVESHAALSLRVLRHETADFDHGHRANVSLLLALQNIRTPAGQLRMQEHQSSMARMWTATHLADAQSFNRRYLRDHPHKSWNQADSFRLETLRDLRDGHLAVETSKEHVLQAMLANWLELAGVIHDLRWTLFEAADSDLVIGDHPLTMHDPTPKYPFSGNGFVSSPNCVNFMPLGADFCLRMDQFSGRSVERRKVTRQIELVNLRSYGWAMRFIYGSNRNTLEALHEFAVAHPGQIPAPRPDPHVICEPADPKDPTVGSEHPAGYPRGLWHDPPDGDPVFMAYRLQQRDDPRTVLLDGSDLSGPS